MRIETDIMPGTHVDIGDCDELLELYRFCRDCGALYKGCPDSQITCHLAVIEEQDKADAAIYSKKTRDYIRKLKTDTSPLPRTSALRTNNDKPGGGIVCSDFCEKIVVPFRERVIRKSDPGSMYLSPWLRFIMASRLAYGVIQNVFEDAFALLRAGFLPVRWEGEWPDGYFLAYCPAGSPQIDKVPSELRVDPFGAKRLTSQAGSTNRVGWIHSEAVADSHEDEWAALCAMADSGQAFRKCYAQLVSTKDGKVALEDLAQRVDSVGVINDILCWNMSFIAVVGGKERSKIQTALMGHAPWCGPINGVPESLIPLLRCHRGLEAYFGALHVPSFDGVTFPINWASYHTADPTAPDPLDDIPLVPIRNEDEIWLYHPTEMNNGRPAFMRMRPEYGTYDEPIDGGPGDVIFIDLARRLARYDKR